MVQWKCEHSVAKPDCFFKRECAFLTWTNKNQPGPSSVDEEEHARQMFLFTKTDRPAFWPYTSWREVHEILPPAEMGLPHRVRRHQIDAQTTAYRVQPRQTGAHWGPYQLPGVGGN